MVHHPRYQRSLEELFLHVYVYIDDWLEPYQEHLPKYSRQKAGISELLTIAVVGELPAQPFESIWYWVVQQSFGNLFPRLPEYSRYHRVLRNAEPLLAALALSVISKQSQMHVIDSKPLPVAKGKRAGWAKLPAAAKGFSTMGMVYGFKLHIAGPGGPGHCPYTEYRTQFHIAKSYGIYEVNASSTGIAR